MSFQMGFPSMIPMEYCDTQLPRNLEYSDLAMDMETLPPPRPLSNYTPMHYAVVKSGVMDVFKKIVVSHTRSLASPAYDKTIALDLETREVYSKIPDMLKARDVGRSFMDPSSLIMGRCIIELLNQDLADREYRALQTCQQVWAAASSVSPEARIASLALDLMIRKVSENRTKHYPTQNASAANNTTHLSPTRSGLPICRAHVRDD